MVAVLYAGRCQIPVRLRVNSSWRRSQIDGVSTDGLSLDEVNRIVNRGKDRLHLTLSGVDRSTEKLRQLSPSRSTLDDGGKSCHIYHGTSELLHKAAPHSGIDVVTLCGITSCTSSSSSSKVCNVGLVFRKRHLLECYLAR